MSASYGGWPRLPAGKPAGLSIRGEAFAFLRERFTLSSAGSGSLVFVSGSVASGKTQLLNEFLHHAAESGALTLSATGAPDEQEFSTGVIEQLFINSSALPPKVADQVAEILHKVADQVAEIPDPESAVSPIIREIRHILLGLARTQPMVIGVDDLQYADDSSLQLLLQLQRRIRSIQLLIVVTQWDRPSLTDRELHTYFTRLPHDHLKLHPLTEKTIEHLATETIGIPAPAELPSQLLELSAGNPMLVNALIEDYRSTGHTGKAVAGPGFSQAVLSFLHRRESALREVAAALAMLGDRGTPETLARIAGVSAGVAEEMIAILDGVGLLTKGRFRHANAEAAALESLSATARAQLHVRVAELKYRQAAPAGEVAAHLVAAGQTAPDWSVGVLRKAAEHAMLGDDLELAAQCLELALSAATSVGDRRTILTNLARISWRANPSATASHLACLDQLATAAPSGQAEALVLARHALWNGDQSAFLSALGSLTGSPDLLDPRTAAVLTLAAQWHFGPVGSGDDDGGEGPARNPDPWHQTAATLADVWSVSRNEHTTASAERILRNCPLDDTTLEALTTAILALANDDKGERAEHWCATLSEQAARRGAVTWQALIEGVWAGLILRRGDIENAAALARSALNLIGNQSWGVSISYPLTALVLAETAAGTFDAATKTLRHPVPEAMFQTVGGLRYLRARGRYHLATDRLLAAISDFMECRRLMDKQNIDLPALVPWRSDLAEVYLRFGNVIVARELAKQQIERSSENDTYARGSAWRILATISTAPERPALLAQSADYLRRSGDRLEAGRALKMPGQTHQVPRWSESTPAARIPQQRNWRASSPDPLTLPAVIAGDGLLDLDDPLESMALSEAELRVAQLAALGQTNRQIGGSLFITVSTVEQHLTRVYRKLGIRGRSELPSQLIVSA
jgi:DNA-binding CsgD family transcriptional regulator